MSGKLFACTCGILPFLLRVIFPFYVACYWKEGRWRVLVAIDSNSVENDTTGFMLSVPCIVALGISAHLLLYLVFPPMHLLFFLVLGQIPANRGICWSIGTGEVSGPLPTSKGS